jgi:RimJ/RimL family protein N-acetyltransferase
MTAVSRERESTGAVYTVEKLDEPGTIREMLAPEEGYAAYPLAQLDPATFHDNEWVLSQGSNGQQALLVHSYTGLGPALFAIGDQGALDVAMSLHPGSRFSFGSMRLEHRRVADKHYVLSRPQVMQRMVVSLTTFGDRPGPTARLTNADLTALNRLYSREGMATAYRPEHLERAVYHGAFVGGELVAVAGTHVYSPAEGIGVVGNVYTHPEFRGRGMATAATSAVTAELLGNCHLVVLTVESQNPSALRVYEKLGYEFVCNMHETPLVRKEPVGAVSLARRLIAGWRGRREGKEVVTR